jgi:hypothetical protein
MKGLSVLHLSLCSFILFCSDLTSNFQINIYLSKTMISINGLKRKSLSAAVADSNNSISTTPKRFRGITHEG